MNWDSRIAYKSLFTRIFKVLETTSRIVIKFPYIHNVERGIRTIGLDMCKKQAGGMYIRRLCYPYADSIYRAWGLSSLS
jgi:hypothetical protein